VSRAALVAASSAVFVFMGGAGVVTATNPGPSPDDDEPSISGDQLQRAADAALAETGQGEVTGTEVGDEESYYEVEVTLDDGRQVDVQLDHAFAVVNDVPDVERAGGVGGD
jgi:hypothetical protein